MKFKLTVVTFLLIIMLTGCKGETATKTYFNNVDFNNTMEDVKSNIDKPLFKEDPDKLIYEDNICNYDVLIMYIFKENKLDDVFVSFTDKYNTNVEYQSRYNILKKALINKYGNKNLVEIKDNCSIWDMDKCQILLNMDNENENSTSILYSKKQ